MKILSIETTTNYGSIAVLENEIVKKEVFFESSDIAGEIVERLQNLTKNERDFDYVVVSIGPGSWTGIRIALSFAKAIVCVKGNIYCVNTFESIFYSIKNLKEKFLCIIPFKKDNFYVSQFNGKFFYKKDFKIEIISLKEILSIVKNGNFIIIGPGVLNLKDYIEIKKIKTIPFLWYPRASLNGILAFYKIKKKISSVLPEPIYGK